MSGDVFTDSYTSASFANKNVGTAKTVSVSGISVSGTDAGNYTFNTTASTPANITTRALTVSATGVNKVYDGTTTASVILSDNRVSGDVFTDSYTGASFATKNVGTAKTVTVSGISISGTDAVNYTANTTATTTASITARPTKVKADAKTKVYGAVDPPLTYQIISGDLVTGDSFSGSLSRGAGENVGSYPIIQNTLTLGNDYDLTFTGDNLTITYQRSGTCDGAAGHAILQPVNTAVSAADASMSVFKAGSTIPLKFRVCDANGNSIGTPGVVTSFTMSATYGVVSGVNEAIVSTTPDSAFRWDSTGQQWIFNLNTKGLQAPSTQSGIITLNDGSTITFYFGLK
jgi:hypothetical protein